MTCDPHLHSFRIYFFAFNIFPVEAWWGLGLIFIVLHQDESDEMLSRGFKDQIYDLYRYLPPELQVLSLSLSKQKKKNQFFTKLIKCLLKMTCILLCWYHWLNSSVCVNIWIAFCDKHLFVAIVSKGNEKNTRFSGMLEKKKR